MKKFLIGFAIFFFVMVIVNSIRSSKGMIKEEIPCDGKVGYEYTQCLWELENRYFALDEAVKSIGGKTTFSDKLDTRYKFFDGKVAVNYGKYTITFLQKDRDFILESIF